MMTAAEGCILPAAETLWLAGCCQQLLRGAIPVTVSLHFTTLTIKGVLAQFVFAVYS